MSRRRLRLKDLSAHDQAEVKKFRKYLKLVSALENEGHGGKRSVAQRIAHGKIYGLVIDEDDEP